MVEVGVGWRKEEGESGGTWGGNNRVEGEGGGRRELGLVVWGTEAKRKEEVNEEEGLNEVA